MRVTETTENKTIDKGKTKLDESSDLLGKGTHLKYEAGQPGLHSEFWDSQDYIETPCPKTNKQTKNPKQQQKPFQIF